MMIYADISVLHDIVSKFCCITTTRSNFQADASINNPFFYKKIIILEISTLSHACLEFSVKP